MPAQVFGGASRALASDRTDESSFLLEGHGLSVMRMLGPESSQPEELRPSSGVPGPVYAIQSYGDDLVLVAAGEAGLLVLRDIGLGRGRQGQDAELPGFEILATLPHPEGHSILDVVSHGTWVYLAAQTGALLVVDLQDPSAPAISSSVELPLGAQVTDLKIWHSKTGDQEVGELRLYAATGVTGLRVFDLDTPGSPKEIETAAIERIDGFPLNAEVMALDEPTGTILLSDGPRTHLFRTPQEDEGGANRKIATIESEQRFVKALALDESARLAAILSIDLLNSKAELAVYSLEDPSQPELLKTHSFGEVLAGLFEAPRPRMELLFAQDRLWVAAGSQGLWSFELQGEMPAMAQPPNALTWPETGISTGIQAEAAGQPTWMLIAGGERGVFSTANAHELAEPQQIFETQGFSSDLLLDASLARLYVADGAGGLLVLEAALATEGRPESADWSRSPSLLGRLELPGAARVERYQDIVYVVDAVLGLVIVDASDPAAMLDLGRIDLGFDFPEALLVVADHLLIAHGRTLSTYALADPAMPRLASRLDLPDFARDLASDGSDVFIALSDLGVGQLDLSDPNRPLLSNHIVRSESAQGAVQALLVTDKQVFAAMGSAGLGRFERRPLAEDESQTRLHWLEDDLRVGEAVGLAYDGWRVWLCARGDGLLVYEDPLAEPPPIVHNPEIHLPWLESSRP